MFNMGGNIGSVMYCSVLLTFNKALWSKAGLALLLAKMQLFKMGRGLKGHVDFIATITQGMT